MQLLVQFSPRNLLKLKERRRKNQSKAVNMKIARVSFLLLVIPVMIHTLPRVNKPSDTPINKQCDLDLQVSNENKISGVFEAAALRINFQAIKESKTIHAKTTTVNPSDSDSKVSVDLSLPDTEGRIVPTIEKLIVQHALDLVETTDCQIPANLNILHEELADKLYQCTTEMGMSQLRFSIMYLETVVASAQRLCNGAESICTASHKYTYGEGLFMCEEDLEELYPELTIDHDGKVEADNKVDKEPTKKEKVKRGFDCPGLSGSDHGCCGNYDGPCYFCSNFCLWHDRVCTQCEHWHCGPACVPDSKLTSPTLISIALPSDGRLASTRLGFQ